MIAEDKLAVLDTNVLVHLARGRAAGRFVDEALGLSKRPERPLISVVTIGEIFSLAEQWNWGSGKKDQLTALLKNVVHVPVHPMVVRRFAELDSFLIRSGRRIQQNDVWIAATASVLGGVLVTTDKDFNALAEAALIELCFVDPVSLPKD